MDANVEATMDLAAWRGLIREIADFPSPGIVFRDVTPLLGSAPGLRTSMDALAALAAPWGTTKVVGIESRGFLFGVPVAERLSVGFAPMRKQGKLPHTVHREENALEYGSDVLELHTDAVTSADRVLIVDDVLATGGTAEAAIRLVERTGAAVAGVLFLVELEGLAGRSRLGTHPVASLLTYP
jgi:adenine phosphoribosyltransferase